MSNVAAIEEQIKGQVEGHNRIIKQLKDELAAAMGEQFFTCSNCTRRSKVNKTTLIRRHWWYVPSHGCGDYWKFQEYTVVCTKCNSAVRVYDKSKYYDDDGQFEFVKNREGVFNEVLNWFPHGDNKIDLEFLRKQNRERQSHRV